MIHPMSELIFFIGPIKKENFFGVFWSTPEYFGVFVQGVGVSIF
jgi:hypothetical protein